MNTRKPMIGEVVLFTPNPDDSVAKSNHNSDPIPAIVTRVWSEVCVNLKLVPDCGPMQDRTSVTHQSANPAGYHFEFQDEHYDPALKLRYLSPSKSTSGLQWVTDDSERFRNWLIEKGIEFEHNQSQREIGLPAEINLFNLGVQWGYEKNAVLKTDSYEFGSLGKFGDGGVMRRIVSDKMTPLENALTDIQTSIEKLSGHPLLTDATIAITNARHNIADFLEGAEPLIKS